MLPVTFGGVVVRLGEVFFSMRRGLTTYTGDCYLIDYHSKNRKRGFNTMVGIV